MIILPMLLLIRILANSTLRFHITEPGTRLNLRSKIKSINQSMTDIFNSPDTDGVLMTDAANAFNNLNRSAYSRNVRHLCPLLAMVAINLHRSPSRLFVGGESISTSEGMTQGNPLAMPLYAIGILPLIQATDTDGARQLLYADDSSADVWLRCLHTWLDSLMYRGPDFGYHLNAAKFVLVVKLHWLEEATRIFADKGIQVHLAAEGHRDLGAVLGTPAFIQDYLQKTTDAWCCPPLPYLHRKQHMQPSRVASSQVDVPLPGSEGGPGSHGTRRAYQLYQASTKLDGRAY